MHREQGDGGLTAWEAMQQIVRRALHSWARCSR
jgi:hypothetical protein